MYCSVEAARYVYTKLMKSYKRRENAKIVIGEKTITKEGLKKKCFSAFQIHYFNDKLFVKLDCQFLNFAFSHDVKLKIQNIKGSNLQMRTLGDSALDFLEVARRLNLKVKIVEATKLDSNKK